LQEGFIPLFKNWNNSRYF